MDQGSYPTHLSPARGDPRGREAAQDVIYGAMLVLQARHEIREVSAYTILVQTSVDAHMTVRDTAAKILRESSIKA